MRLPSWAHKELGIHIALVTGGGGNHTTFGKTDFNQILTNFSPRSKNRDKIPSMPQDGEIDLLIATDCISEGQNLQDCDYLVNYDIHWNPVRIIQRFGRIDRIGSVNHTVQLVNFWPTQDLDKYVNLKNRVEARMALVDIAATFEDNILKTDEIEELIHEDMRYRDKQLLRLREEVLDLEDFSESVALNEFTLDDFRIELSKYIEANRKLLEDAPLGLYAVVPPHPEHKVITPGVVFCFKQKGDVTSGETVNPLQPYYLVYVRDDGTVRFSFAQPKQILEIYRLLCSGKAAAYEQLCQLFDTETNNGADMNLYNKLLAAAVDSIARTFQKRVAAGLQTGRDFVIPDQHEQARETTDFELITWLVIKVANRCLRQHRRPLPPHPIHSQPQSRAVQTLARQGRLRTHPGNRRPGTRHQAHPRPLQSQGLLRRLDRKADALHRHPRRTHRRMEKARRERAARIRHPHRRNFQGHLRPHARPIRRVQAPQARKPPRPHDRSRTHLLHAGRSCHDRNRPQPRRPRLHAKQTGRPRRRHREQAARRRRHRAL